MKKRRINIYISVFFVAIIFIITNVLHIRLSASDAAKSYLVEKSINVIDEYGVDKTTSFLLCVDKYQEYNVVIVKNVFGVFYRAVSCYNNVSTSREVPLEHLAAIRKGYYFDYITVKDKEIAYIVAGDINGIDTYNGNLNDILSIQNRFREQIQIKEVKDGIICFWGKFKKGDLFKVGELTAFDKDGNSKYSEVIY